MHHRFSKCPAFSTTQPRIGLYPLPPEALRAQAARDGAQDAWNRSKEEAEAGVGVGSLAGCICVEGYHGSPPQGQPCRPCERGSWKSWSGDGACQACHANASSHGAATKPGDCFCEAGFQPHTLSSVSQPVLSAAQAKGDLRCEACSPGKHKAAAGDTACLPCPAGTYQPGAGAKACMACPERTFMPASGATACVHCPAPDQWSPSASTSVSSCMCPAGREGPPGACYCTDCLPGMFKAVLEGKQACAPCTPGSYSNASGSTTCSMCPKDTFQDLSGASTCKACPVLSQHRTKRTGASSSSECHCAPGYELPLAAKIGEACSACGIGMEKELVGSHRCNECKAGTYAATPATGSCTRCASGTYQPAAKQSSCLACPARFHGTVAGATALHDCVCGRGLRPRHLALQPAPTLALAPASSVVQVLSPQSDSVIRLANCSACPEGEHSHRQMPARSRARLHARTRTHPHISTRICTFEGSCARPTTHLHRPCILQNDQGHTRACHRMMNATPARSASTTSRLPPARAPSARSA